jgi:hypothetical protein
MLLATLNDISKKLIHRQNYSPLEIGEKILEDGYVILSKHPARALSSQFAAAVKKSKNKLVLTYGYFKPFDTTGDKITKYTFIENGCNDDLVDDDDFLLSKFRN